MARDGETADHDELANLAWIEALGALDPEDRRRLAAHLREGCPACLAALRGGNDVVARLAHLFAPASPSPALRARIERLAARRSPANGSDAQRPPRRARIASAASWVALAVAALFGADAWRESGRLREELALERAARIAASDEAAAERSRIERLASDHEALGALLRAVAARDARALALTGPDGAGARAFVAGERLVLFVHDLPSAPAGRTYQAWTIEDGTPRSAGTFDTGADGSARHAAQLPLAIGEGATIAVTLEPAGGVALPTGAIVLAQR